ncbi:DUF2092 domain-containing protein [Mesorhizobium sp. CCNWLW179-1]|uniref:DUF2092 domain-containing protein n=1 Tax=unclassified Mesorhizobium TaxID=325217 RepID=UPI0030150C8A
MRCHIGRAVIFIALFLASLPVPTSFAQAEVEPDAAKVLGAMSEYLGSLERFSVDYDVETEVVSYDGQKLQFASSGEIKVQRPDKLYASRKGAVADVELILDGSALTLYGKIANAFFQLPATTIDQAVDALRNDVGFDAPGADLLSEQPLQHAETDTISGTHVGMTFLDGVQVHHLAFRGKEVDWQLWVTDGEKPLPLKYVITSKWVAASPEYSIEFRNWNTAPSIDNSSFVFMPSEDAKKLETFTVDEIGEIDLVKE